jgi:hypothetical protein
MKINQVAYLQAEIANEYMRQHNLKPCEFVELDAKYGILRFIEIGYEPFHLTGKQGVIDEVEDYVKIQREHETAQRAIYRISFFASRGKCSHSALLLLVGETPPPCETTGIPLGAQASPFRKPLSRLLGGCTDYT